MSEWLELLFDALTNHTNDPNKETLLRWVHEAIKERNNLLQKLSYQLDAHEALLHTNAHLRGMEKAQADEIHILRGVHDRQVAEIHKLKAQIKVLGQQVFDEGEGRV